MLIRTSQCPRTVMAVAVSLVQLAKRVLVTLILALVQQCWRADVGCSKEDVVEAMHRKWSKMCIPTEAMLRMHSSC